MEEQYQLICLPAEVVERGHAFMRKAEARCKGQHGATTAMFSDDHTWVTTRVSRWYLSETLATYDIVSVALTVISLSGTQ